MMSYEEDWKEKLANNFITVTALTSPAVSAHLANLDITEWELVFSCQNGKCSLNFKFSKMEMKVLNFSTNSSSLKSKLVESTKLKFDFDISILVYSDVMLRSLESSSSIIDLKRSLKKKFKICQTKCVNFCLIMYTIFVNMDKLTIKPVHKLVKLCNCFVSKERFT